MKQSSQRGYEGRNVWDTKLECWRGREGQIYKHGNSVQHWGWDRSHAQIFIRPKRAGETSPKGSIKAQQLQFKLKIFFQGLLIDTFLISGTHGAEWLHPTFKMPKAWSRIHLITIHLLPVWPWSGTSLSKALRFDHLEI